MLTCHMHLRIKNNTELKDENYTLFVDYMPTFSGAYTHFGRFLYLCITSLLSTHSLFDFP